MVWRRKARWGAACSLGFVVVLSAAGGRWLQQREAWLPAGTTPAAIYILGGGGGERVAGLGTWLDRNGGTHLVLIPNEGERNRWSSKHQRNLSTAEWRLQSLRHLPATRGEGCGVVATLIPGTFTGTDRELDILGRYLATRPGLHPVALLTSRYHIRRALNHARAHLPPGAVAGIITAAPCWRDYAPWTVGVELLKLLRDHLGLGRAPLLHRGWWTGSAALLRNGRRCDFVVPVLPRLARATVLTRAYHII